MELNAGCLVIVAVQLLTNHNNESCIRQLWDVTSLCFCPPSHQNPLPVACCVAFPCSSPPEPPLHMASNTSPPTVAKSIRRYRKFPKAARSQKSPKNLQPLSPSAEVNVTAVSDGSVPGKWTDASSQETQPPILSSTCSMH